MEVDLDHAIQMAASAVSRVRESEYKISEAEFELKLLRDRLESARGDHTYWLKQVVAAATGGAE